MGMPRSLSPGLGSWVGIVLFLSASGVQAQKTDSVWIRNGDRITGEVHVGRVPPYSVVVSGSTPGKPLPNGEPGPSLYCAVIVKRVDEKTRAKTSINELLRD